MVEFVLIAYAAVLFVMSCITFITFVRDKKLAEKKLDLNVKPRIKEKTLLGMTAFGGALGALFGRLAARHKTKKIYFSITIIFCLILQLGVLAFLLYAKFGN